MKTATISKLTLALLLAGTFVMPAASYAAQGKAPAHASKGMENVFAKYDADKSGTLSEQEYAAYAESNKKQSDAEAKKEFVAGDVNKDGKLTHAEFKTALASIPASAPAKAQTGSVNQ